MTTDIKFENGSLIITRFYSASREEVFDAWIETSKIKQWWGCAECKEVESEVEPKVGGKYNHHMTIETPDGEHQAPGFATLIEYHPPHRLAYTSTDDNDPMIISVDFSEVDGGTQVRLIHSNIPDMKVDGGIELREIIRGGWSAAMDKLDVFLNSEINV